MVNSEPFIKQLRNTTCCNINTEPSEAYNGGLFLAPVKPGHCGGSGGRGGVICSTHGLGSGGSVIFNSSLPRLPRESRQGKQSVQKLETLAGLEKSSASRLQDKKYFEQLICIKIQLHGKDQIKETEKS